MHFSHQSSLCRDIIFSLLFLLLFCKSMNIYSFLWQRKCDKLLLVASHSATANGRSRTIDARSVPKFKVLFCLFLLTKSVNLYRAYSASIRLCMCVVCSIYCRKTISYYLYCVIVIIEHNFMYLFFVIKCQ